MLCLKYLPDLGQLRRHSLEECEGESEIVAGKERGERDRDREREERRER